MRKIAIIAKIRQAATELQPTNPDLASQLNEIVSDWEKKRQEKAEKE
jgi:hypothetical protein